MCKGCNRKKIKFYRNDYKVFTKGSKNTPQAGKRMKLRLHPFISFYGLRVGGYTLARMGKRDESASLQDGAAHWACVHREILFTAFMCHHHALGN